MFRREPIFFADLALRFTQSLQERKYCVDYRSPSLILRLSAYRSARLSKSSSMTDNHTGHSAEVKMHVVRDGSKLQVSQLGPDFLLLDEADDFEGPAQIILSVDGVTHSREVQLQCGSTSTEKTISFL